MMVERRTCTAVYDNECSAPAGWGTGAGYATNNSSSAEVTCYSCGLPVCRNCSDLVTYAGRRCRLGKDCIASLERTGELVKA